jgi:hypothetical protein
MKHVSPSDASRAVRLAGERLGSALATLERLDEAQTRVGSALSALEREAQTQVRRKLGLGAAFSTLRGGKRLRQAQKKAERKLRLGAALSAFTGLAALGRGKLRAGARRREAQTSAARKLHLGAGVLALAVLADSGVEHYRGSFQNKAMFAPLIAATLSLFAGVSGGLGMRAPVVLDGVYRVAEATGIAGLCFHAYNILKRPSGLSWLNLFYAAPVGAPFALTLAGFFGRCAVQVGRAGGRLATLFGVPAGRLLTAATAAGVAGTVGEAGLLHFRGAYHNPAMYLPVSIPPVTAGLLGATAVAPKSVPRTPVRGALWATAALGVAGVGFHVYGVSRNMGGWRNWSQNVLNGPPIPAPPSFLGLALIGIAALALMDGNDA